MMSALGVAALVILVWLATSVFSCGAYLDSKMRDVTYWNEHKDDPKPGSPLYNAIRARAEWHRKSFPWGGLLREKFEPGAGFESDCGAVPSDDVTLTYYRQRSAPTRLWWGCERKKTPGGYLAFRYEIDFDCDQRTQQPVSLLRMEDGVLTQNIRSNVPGFPTDPSLRQRFWSRLSKPLPPPAEIALLKVACEVPPWGSAEARDVERQALATPPTDDLAKWMGSVPAYTPHISAGRDERPAGLLKPPFAIPPN